jgi:hypothetical protein
MESERGMKDRNGNGTGKHGVFDRLAGDDAPSVGPVDLFDGPPIPLEPPKPPALPSGIFPGVIGDMVDAAAEAHEVPRELPATFALVSLAIACQGRFSIRPEPGYFEQLAIWAATAMVSGSRKTPTMVSMMDWAYNWQHAKAVAMAGEVTKAQADDALLRARVKSLRTKAGKAADDTTYQLLKQQADDLEAQARPIPVAPRLVAEDITTEHLGTLLNIHEQCIGIVSDESGPLGSWGGRYYANGAANIDLPLKAYSGAPAIVDRGSRPSLMLSHPLLSIGLAPQPTVIGELVSNETYRRRGLPARFIFFSPQSTLGYRALNGQPIPDDVASAYAARLVELVEIKPAVNADGDHHPRVLEFAGDAWRVWKDFAVEVEAMMRPGGQLERMTDWAGKLPGCVARIAALFHLAEHGAEAIKENIVQKPDVERAVALARIAIPHAKAVFESLDGDGILESAKRVWKGIAKTDGGFITLREIWNPFRGTYKTTAEIEPVIRTLVDHAYIAELPNAEIGRPGRPSRRFGINPERPSG